ncbi:Ribosomal protein L15 [Quillaja saponaria]|uniref:Mitochondrial import inner membrane translocase subunit Tim21 n=1 Tax=Quillaja saponaria TaxID=32244 RepID=A0AAD7VIL4_QUISA|nr:Ribosomal protein L15 [Quillaja saponaria]
MGAFKNIVSLWRNKQLDSMKLLSTVRCSDYAQKRALSCLTRPSQPAEARWLEFKATQESLFYSEDNVPKNVLILFRKNTSKTKKDISTVDDPFDPLTYNIPEKPVTFAEGASYTVIILAGLGIAAAAGYAVFKELIFEPKEYKIFGKALKRIQDDGQVRVRIGSPITGYGQESRNRAARQRIPSRIWTDEDGIEHVEVNFYIRGPQGSGKVFSEMFKDKVDKQWKFTYLIVEIRSPVQKQLILESYMPAYSPEK